jgi:Mg2+/Co2+ transporter CorC
MNLVVLVANHERKPKSISLIGLGDTGSIVAGAMTMVGDRVKDIYISRDSLSALDVNDIHAPFFMPGSMKYGGVVGMLRDSKRNVVVFGSSKSDVSKKQLNELMNQKSRLTTIQEKSFPLIID